MPNQNGAVYGLTFLSPIIEMQGAHALRDKPLSQIDQAAIDNAAAALFPRR